MGIGKDPFQRAFMNMIIIHKCKLIAGSRPNEHYLLPIQLKQVALTATFDKVSTSASV